MSITKPTLLLACCLGLLALTTPAAQAAEVSALTLDLRVLNGDGTPKTSIEAGQAYNYVLNYAVSGSNLDGVQLAITLSLPSGTGQYGIIKPAGWTLSDPLISIAGRTIGR